MNKVMVIVEGATEKSFIRDVLAPVMALKNIYIYATQIGSPGHKGGNVKYQRFINDLKKHLKGQQNIIVTTMFDYYAIDSKWPGFSDSNNYNSSFDKCTSIERATIDKIQEELVDVDVEERFIPYFSMHEFEALLFSNVEVLAEKIEQPLNEIESILNDCGSPEEINSHPDTAPSKRLMKLTNNSYRKVAMGKIISEKIGIEKIRQECPNFDNWLKKLEAKIM